MAAVQKVDEKDNGDEGVTVTCSSCDAQMVPLLSETIYGRFVPVFCNECWSHIPGADTLYHCPTGHCWSHPAGYDICKCCAEMKCPRNRPRPPSKRGMKNKFIRKMLSRNVNKLESKEHGDRCCKLNLSPTLQCVLSQQLDLQNPNDDGAHSKHLDVVDELTRLSALSLSTLSQLTCSNENGKASDHSLADLQAMMLKYGAMQQIQSKLSESIRTLSIQNCRMLSDRLSDWRNWDKLELWQWVKSLEDGRFHRKYSVHSESEEQAVNVVKESILRQNICGKHLDLEDTKRDLLIQSLGITDFDDRLALLDHIGDLVRGQFKYDRMLPFLPPNDVEAHLGMEMDVEGSMEVQSTDTF